MRRNENPGVSRAGLQRRGFLKGVGVVAAAPFVFTRNAWAQQKSLQIGIYAGTQGEYVRKNVIPAFENEFDCKVLAREGITLGQITLMRAEKNNPRYTVMFIDDVGIETCIQENLITKLPVADMPNMQLVYPQFRFNDDYAVAMGVTPNGPYYNTSLAKPLESYADLWSDKLRRKITLANMTISGGVFVMIAAAAIATGKPFQEAQYLADQTLDKLREIKPNVLNLFTSSGTSASTVLQGEALYGAISASKWIHPYTQKGAPIDMTYPKEGGFLGINTQVLVRNAPNAALGAAFINRMLAPEVQKGLSEYTLTAPPIRDLEFSKDTLKYLPYPLAEMERMKLFLPDWKHINAVRGKWTEIWNRVFTA
jgi:putative spermidine/putrescine transport system substrate-binding protein